MFRKIFLVLVTALLLGCIGGGAGFDPVNAAKASGQVQKFLQEHPNAKIVAVLLNEAQTRERLKNYAECSLVTPQPSYVVTFEDAQTKAVAFVGEAGQKALCVVIQQSGTNTAGQTGQGTQNTATQPGTAPGSQATAGTLNVAGTELVEYKDEQRGYKIMKPVGWKAEIREGGYVMASSGSTDAIIWPVQLSGQYAKGTGVDLGNYLIGVIKQKIAGFAVENIYKAQDNSVMEVVGTYPDPAGSGVRLKGVLTTFADGKGNGLLAGYEAPEAEFSAKEQLLRKIASSYASLKLARPASAATSGGSNAGGAAQPASRLVQAGDSDVSMLIPGGWKFIGGSSCTTKFVQAYDPDNKARRVFIYGGLGPVYFSAQAKQQAIDYCNGLRAAYGPSHPCTLVPGQPALYDLPLASGTSKEAFLATLPEYFQTQMIRSILPYAEPFGLTVNGKEQVGGDEVFDVTFSFNGLPAAGKMTVGPMIPDAVTGTMYGYGIVGLTAENKEALGALYPTLLKSLDSVTLSQSYISSCKELQNAQAKAYSQVSKTLGETSDIIVKGYEGRQPGLDVASEKRSDVTLGVERVYNPDNDEVYEVPNGFYDAYNINRESFQKSNLQQLTPDQYTQYAPLNGALHIG